MSFLDPFKTHPHEDRFTPIVDHMRLLGRGDPTAGAVDDFYEAQAAGFARFQSPFVYATRVSFLDEPLQVFVFVRGSSGEPQGLLFDARQLSALPPQGVVTCLGTLPHETHPLRGLQRMVRRALAVQSHVADDLDRRAQTDHPDLRMPPDVHGLESLLHELGSVSFRDAWFDPGVARRVLQFHTGGLGGVALTGNPSGVSTDAEGSRVVYDDHGLVLLKKNHTFRAAIARELGGTLELDLGSSGESSEELAPGSNLPILILHGISASKDYTVGDLHGEHPAWRAHSGVDARRHYQAWRCGPLFAVTPRQAADWMTKMLRDALAPPHRPYFWWVLAPESLGELAEAAEQLRSVESKRRGVEITSYQMRLRLQAWETRARLGAPSNRSRRTVTLPGVPDTLNDNRKGLGMTAEYPWSDILRAVHLIQGGSPISVGICTESRALLMMGSPPSDETIATSFALVGPMLEKA